MADREYLNLTVREQTRREIADQVEQFLQQGGHINVVAGPSAASDLLGRVWWEAGSSLRGGGPIASNSFL